MLNVKLSVCFVGVEQMCSPRHDLQALIFVLVVELHQLL